MNEEIGVSNEDISEEDHESEAKSQSRFSKDREKYRRQGHAAGFDEGYQKAKRELEMQNHNQNAANNSFTQGQGMQQQNPQYQNDIEQVVQQKLNQHIENFAYQQQMNRNKEAIEKLASKVNQAKGKYNDFDETVSPIAEDQSQKLSDIVVKLGEYDNGADMLYHMVKDPMILGNLKGLHDSPRMLKSALDKFSKKIDATKEEKASPSDPIEPPQSSHWVAGSNSKILSIAEAKQLYLNSRKKKGRN